jgi:hypothetical protein
MIPSEHPDFETLRQFVLGRLDRKSMTRIEDHLQSCCHCGNAAVHVPDDRLVKLLRASAAGCDKPNTRSQS